jgi:hypothetical protein
MLIKKNKFAGHWWLIPIILPTWRLRSGGSGFKASPGKLVHEIPISKITRAKLDWKGELK